MTHFGGDWLGWGRMTSQVLVSIFVARKIIAHQDNTYLMCAIGDNKYLEMAKVDSDYSYLYKDDVCGGGLWWKTDRNYKNAIPNELFIKLAASLHNRIPGDTMYLNQAVEVVEWFKMSGMINAENLINDGLTSDCRNNGQVMMMHIKGISMYKLI